ncbi:MAG: ribonuclease R [Saprospiraceae bacterium]|nr:ribonuclease R [Saprospiraceae bacterium]
MTKRKKKREKKFSSSQLQTEILEIFKSDPKKRLNPRQIGKKLPTDNNKDSIQYAIDKLVEKGKLLALEDFKYKLKSRAVAGKPLETYEGYVDMTRSGAAFIVCEGIENDVFVSARHLNTALNGDRVKVGVWRNPKRGRPEGEVLEVLRRSVDHFLGTIHLSTNYGFVTPDRLNSPFDIFVAPKNAKGAADGDKVVVRIVNWVSTKSRNPEGVVTTVLGKEGGSDIEMKAILINNGFNLEFSEAAIAESELLNDQLSEEEVARRRDMRQVPTCTIDPVDAKDFDDAISFQYLENGNLEIGVHIADVSHYVLPDTALDKEALERSTSVYLVDRVLPMLPEKISNELCSLRPNEDKATFSAVFEFDQSDRIVSRWFGKTLIHSDRRFTYEEAQEGIVSGAGDFAEELQKLNSLAKILRKDRFKKGSIDFDSEEVRFRLDEDGVPIEVYVKDRFDAHMLVEDFMLLANKEVATFIHKKGEGHEIPFVYRIHDEPDPDKVAELARFAKELGFEMDISTPEAIGRSYNRMTKAAQDDPGLALLQPLAIRTMAKAAYSSDNIGHYGLGFEFYTHFTSPIRRYSDVLVHRILEKNLDGKTYRMKKSDLEEKCQHISSQERRAMSAERESIKYKQAEYMEKHVGDVFEGRVSGMIDFGFFVELTDSKCEGMVGFDSMDESYEIADSRLFATGKRTKKVIKMGDIIRVKIEEVDLARRRIEMKLEEEVV